MGTSNEVLFEKIGDFSRSIPLHNGRESLYLVNKSTFMPNIRNADFIEELYKGEII